MRQAAEVCQVQSHLKKKKKAKRFSELENARAVV